MYSKISHDIQQAYYQDNYANDGQRFVAWYLRNIHGLDTIETKDCITDGANDKQIDAVYIDNQNCTIYIIQGKFLSNEFVDAEPVREVLSSWILVQNLDALQESANEKLKVKINEISNALDDDYDICFRTYHNCFSERTSSLCCADIQQKAIRQRGTQRKPYYR